jgi:hypothetical protein
VAKSKYFIYDIHQDRRLYFSYLKHASVQDAKLQCAKLLFVGNYTFGWPTIKKTNVEEDIVEGSLIEFYDAKYEQLFLDIVLSKADMKQVTCSVMVDGKSVKVKTFIITGDYREEVPLRENYLKLKEIYRAHGFNINTLKIALKETLKKYYN